MLKVFLKCWGCAGKKENILSVMALMMDVHRCAFCAQLQVEPRNRTGFNKSFVHLEVTYQAREALALCYLPEKYEMKESLQIFTKSASANLGSEARHVQRAVIRKHRNEKESGRKAFSELNLALQKVNSVQHSAKFFDMNSL